MTNFGSCRLGNYTAVGKLPLGKMSYVKYLKFLLILSAWPDATILVSAAHCNQICKDSVTNQPLEICCCRVDADPGSCKNVKSSYLFIVGID